jgi:hypothetical protein
VPRNPATTKLARVDSTRESIRKIELMLDQARADHRKALLGAREAGVTMAELIRRTGSSHSRILENIRRAAADKAI